MPVAGRALQAVLLAAVVVDMHCLEIRARLLDEGVRVAALRDVQVPRVKTNADVLLVVYRAAHRNKVRRVVVVHAAEVFDTDREACALCVSGQLVQRRYAGVKILLDRQTVRATAAVMQNGRLDAKLQKYVDVALQQVDGCRMSAAEMCARSPKSKCPCGIEKPSPSM